MSNYKESFVLSPLFRYVTLVVSMALFLGSFGGSKPSYAQSCDTVYEMIAQLRKPRIGSFNLWDTVYGEMDWKERFTSIIRKPDSKNTIAIGERYSFEDGPKSLIFTEITPRGRSAWDHIYEIPDLRKIVQILPHSEGYMILGNKENVDGKKSVWLGFFDRMGKRMSEKEIANRGFSIEGQYFLYARDQKKIILVTATEPVDYSTPPYTVIHWLDLKGKSLKNRAFLIGVENKINAIVPHGEKHYMAAGYVRAEGGRKAGWILKVNEAGGMVWQRQYNRGAAAVLNDIKSYGKDYVVVTGSSAPITGVRKSASWVMMNQVLRGDIAWQRYYRENLDMVGRSVEISEDNQISVLMSAMNPESEEDKEYVRLIDLNPRGVILQSRSYYNALGAAAYGMIIGNNLSRVIYGYTDVEYQLESSGHSEDVKSNLEYHESETKTSRQAWIVAGVAPDSYEDPCVQPLSVLP